MKRYYGRSQRRGWFGERYRHRLAAKGIRTFRRGPSKKNYGIRLAPSLALKADLNKRDILRSRLIYKPDRRTSFQVEGSLTRGVSADAKHKLTSRNSVNATLKKNYAGVELKSKITRNTSGVVGVDTQSGKYVGVEHKKKKLRVPF